MGHHHHHHQPVHIPLTVIHNYGVVNVKKGNLKDHTHTNLNLSMMSGYDTINTVKGRKIGVYNYKNLIQCERYPIQEPGQTWYKAIPFNLSTFGFW